MAVRTVLRREIVDSAAPREVEFGLRLHSRGKRLLKNSGRVQGERAGCTAHLGAG